LFIRIRDRFEAHLCWRKIWISDFCLETENRWRVALRGLGGNIAPDRQAGLRTPRWRRRLEAELQSLAGPDGRPALRFEIAYGHAFKALPRAQPGTPATVSLEEMRSLVRTPRRR